MSETWIMYAGVAVWAGIGLYAAFLATVQRSISNRLAALEAEKHEEDD